MPTRYYDAGRDRARADVYEALAEQGQAIAGTVAAKDVRAMLVHAHYGEAARQRVRAEAAGLLGFLAAVTTLRDSRAEEFMTANSMLSNALGTAVNHARFEEPPVDEPTMTYVRALVSQSSLDGHVLSIDQCVILSVVFGESNPEVTPSEA